LTNQPAHHEEIRILGSLNMPVFFTLSENYKAFPGRNKFTQTIDTAKVIQQFSQELILPSTKLRLRTETDQYLQKLAIPTQCIFEADILAPVVRAVLDGLGPGFIPLPYITNEFSEKKVRIFGPKKGLWHHSIWLLTRQQTKPSRVVDTFAEVFESIGQQNIALEFSY
jgi:DNA-binding transcriptional LysR family regulator